MWLLGREKVGPSLKKLARSIILLLRLQREKLLSDIGQIFTTFQIARTFAGCSHKDGG